MINVKDTLALDDNNEYVVVSKLNYENREYFYLVDINENRNLKFCYLNGDKLVELENKELIEKLLPIFLKKCRNDFEF